MNSEDSKIATLINKSGDITEDNMTKAPTGEEVEIIKMEGKKCCMVELNEGISHFNIISYYIVQFSYVCACTFIDACQDYLLEDSKYYGIPKDKVGRINGDIILCDTLFLIAFIYIYGSLHDIFGRKIMVVYGFISMGISFILYPLAGNIYPNLILVRLLFSNGISAVTTQPLLSDYVRHNTIGKSGGMAGVVSGLGAIFAALFLLKLQSYINLFEVYCITSGICFLVAFICAFGIKSVYREGSAERFYSKFIFPKLKEGFQECSRNYPLAIGIATNSLARMNSLLITLFLVMWVKQHDMSEKEAVNLGHMISGIGNSIGLVAALMFGYLYHKNKASNLLLITHSLVVIGYVAFYLSPYPHHWLTLVSFSCASFGFYGFMIIGFVMVNVNCGKTAKGTIMGINCLFGAVSLLILAKLGGLAFDIIDKSVPFLFAAFCSAVLMLVVLFTRSKIDKSPRQYAQTHYVPQNSEVLASESSHLETNIKNKI